MIVHVWCVPPQLRLADQHVFNKRQLRLVKGDFICCLLNQTVSDQMAKKLIFMPDPELLTLENTKIILEVSDQHLLCGVVCTHCLFCVNRFSIKGMVSQLGA